MTCRRTDEGYLLQRHLPDCTSNRCLGCVACERDDHGTPVRHCKHKRHCTSHLASGEHTCPKCLARIRGNMAGIVTATALMLDEAIEAGVESEALSLAGPTANVVTSRWRRINAARGGEWVEETDYTHPAIALGEWERIIREDLGHDAERLVSDNLSGSVGYLDWVLTDLARDEGQALVLAELGSAVASLRSHLEAVLHDSRSPEKGAPCFTCASEDPEGKGPRLFKRYRDDDRSGASDRWICPADEDHRWTESEYRLQVERDRIRNAPWLSAADMFTRCEVKAGTVYAWASERRIRSRIQGGRKVYAVADVEREAGLAVTA